MVGRKVLVSVFVRDAATASVQAGGLAMQSVAVKVGDMAAR